MKSRFPVSYCSAVLGGITYIAFAILAYVRYPLPLSPKQHWLSDLGNQIENPHGAIFYNVGVILSAICLAIWFTAGLSQWKLKQKAAHQRLLLFSQTAGILAASAMIMSAIYPINLFQIHAFWSKIHFMMFGMGFGFSVAALRYHPFLPKVNLYIGASAAVLPTLMFVFDNSYWLEWVTVGCMIVYMLLIGKASFTLTRATNTFSKQVVDGQLKEVSMKTVKQHLFKKKVLILSFVVLMLLAIVSLSQRTNRQEKISELGKYQGYSEEIYDGTHRTSDYLMLSDGTRLAYDLIIPSKKGVPADKPLPVLLSYTPYGRTWTIFDENGEFLVNEFVDTKTKILARLRYWISGDKGRIMDPLFRDRWLGPVVKHGYIVVAVDRPGTGASFSSPTPGSMETASKFLGEIIDWIVAQSWSDGNVAMYGESQEAMVQFAAGAAGNPHLKAILPASSAIEMYQSVMYPGGVFDKAFTSMYASVPLLESMATPVDSDLDGVFLAQARESRNNKVSAQSALEIARQYPFRDGIAPDGTNTWQLMALYPFIERINQAPTPILMTVGWYDVFTTDIFYWYDNLTVPKRLIVRPTDHSQVSDSLVDLDYGTEALRWLDYWLKGIDNGIMDEPPIHYYVQNGPNKGAWRTSAGWPLATQKSILYYLGPGKSGTVDSVNDGSLSPDLGEAASSMDPYTVDYTTTTGTKSRWSAVDVAHDYPDLSSNDAKALTYTTSPLEEDLEITGHPVVHLWLNTRAPDLDVFVYLEEVSASGKSTYITEGILRASHRKLVKPPFNNLGLPYQSHFEVDQLPVPQNEPFEMVFYLLPTSFQFHAGNRIRITIAFADADNFYTPILDPAPQLQLLREPTHPSYVELPVNK